MIASGGGLSRRAALRAGAGLLAGFGAGVAFAAPAAASTGAGPAGRPSANGWQIEDGVDAGGSIWTRPVPGTPLSVAARIPDVQVVLWHVVRRFHYEIDALRDGDVIGHRVVPKSLRGPETNHGSGTAVDIRPGWYPPGVSGGFFAPELAVIRDILADCEGVVAWGGDFRTPHESHFEIAVRPTGPQAGTTVNPASARSINPANAQLAQVAQKIRRWNARPGLGAGA